MGEGQGSHRHTGRATGWPPNTCGHCLGPLTGDHPRFCVLCCAEHQEPMPVDPAVTLYAALQAAETGTNEFGATWNTARLVAALRVFYADMAERSAARL